MTTAAKPQRAYMLLRKILVELNLEEKAALQLIRQYGIAYHYDIIVDDIWVDLRAFTAKLPLQT